MSSESALKKLLKRNTESQQETKSQALISRPKTSRPEILKKRLGRPVIEDAKKARNFTLCLAPQFIKFLDKMEVKDPKVQGRGRKIRFIIERFIEHEKRSLSHMRVLRETLHQVQTELGEFKGRVRKGEKLSLSIKERASLSKSIDQVMMLVKILNYPPKNLQRMLPKEDWAIMSFCLDWNSNQSRVVL